jgi:hypothetical protein
MAGEARSRVPIHILSSALWPTSLSGGAAWTVWQFGHRVFLLAGCSATCNRRAQWTEMNAVMGSSWGKDLVTRCRTLPRPRRKGPSLSVQERHNGQNERMRQLSPLNQRISNGFPANTGSANFPLAAANASFSRMMERTRLAGEPEQFAANFRLDELTPRADGFVVADCDYFGRHFPPSKRSSLRP